MLKWHGLAGNTVMTPNITGSIHVIPKGFTFSGSKEASGVWIEWKAPHAEGAQSGGVFFEDPDGIRLEIYAPNGAGDQTAPTPGAPPRWVSAARQGPPQRADALRALRDPVAAVVC